MAAALVAAALLSAVRAAAAPTGPTGTFAKVAITGAIPSNRFPPRAAPLTFHWQAAIWVAGGLDVSSEPVSDVWRSYDQGRTWQTAAALPGLCTGRGGPGVVYAGAVYLPCSEGGEPTYYSSSATLNTAWSTASSAAISPLFGYSTARMAVPFDGVGSLVAVNGAINTNYFSAVYQLQAATNTWKVVPATTTPWSPRDLSAVTSDAEGAVLIMAGGNNFGKIYNDVWQLTWSSAITPQYAQLTASAMWIARCEFALFSVHDWLFIYGGSFGPLDDVWMSSDYGTTWTQYAAAATQNGRSYVNALSDSRRFFIVGGSSPLGVVNDVWVSDCQKRSKSHSHTDGSHCAQRSVH